MWKSARMYFALLGHWTWVLVADIGGSALGLVDAFGNRVPVLLWAALLVIGPIAASLYVFHLFRLQCEADLKTANDREVAAETKLAAYLDARKRQRELGSILVEGRRFLLEALASPEQVPAFGERVQSWKKHALTRIETLCGKGQAIAFFHIPLSAVRMSGGINQEHNDLRTNLAGLCDNVKNLIESSN